MTVAELIKKLQAMPQDREVAVLDSDGDPIDIGQVVDYGAADWVVVQPWGL